MDARTILLDLYGRLPELARGAVDGLDQAALVARPGGHPNTIAWLVWHAARVEDHHVAELVSGPQIWTQGEWAASVGLDPDPGNTGYGHSEAQAAQVRPSSAAALLAYADTVHARTVAFLETVTDADLVGVVDRRFDPPVTMAVRLVSIATDALQHLGQAAYARAILAG